MQGAMRSLLLPVAAMLLLSAPCCQAQVTTSVTPVEKVLQMLYKMTDDGEAAMKAETKTYTDYLRQVAGMRNELKFNIDTSLDKQEELEAFITNTEAIIEDLSKDIAELEADIAEQTKNKNEKLSVRAQEAAENNRLRVDAQESIDALDRAIQSLSARSQDYEQPAMLQKLAAKDPTLSAVLANLNFLQEGWSVAEPEPKKILIKDCSNEVCPAIVCPDGGSPRQNGDNCCSCESPKDVVGGCGGTRYGCCPMSDVAKDDSEGTNCEDAEVNAPKANAYEFQSGKILDLLEELQKKFRAELEEVMATETKQSRASDLEVLHLTNAIEAMDTEREKNTVSKGEKASELAAAKGKLASTNKDLAADQKTLSDLEATFSLKTSAYRENQKVRTEELEAVRRATDIVAGVKVNRNYKKNIYIQKPVTLLQLSRGKGREFAKNRAVSVLKQRAKSMMSRRLVALAAQLAGSPFAKVIDMIAGLLDKMKAEAAEEAEHKAWCDKQLAHNEKRRKKLSTEISQLQSSIDTKTAQIAQNKKDMKTLTMELEKLTKDMLEMTKQRQEEKKKNTQTIIDAGIGETATKEALDILNRFYEGQSLMQVSQDPVDTPEMAAYKGAQDTKNGVIGMLEVIESDFARLLTDTQAAEKAATTEFKENMADMNALKTEKDGELHETGLQTDRAKFLKSQDSKSLRRRSKDYKNAMNIYGDLKSSCVEVKVSFEERDKMRNEEIAALRQAYDVLNSKTEGEEGTVTIEPPDFGTTEEPTMTISPPDLGTKEPTITMYTGQ